MKATKYRPSQSLDCITRHQKQQSNRITLTDLHLVFKRADENHTGFVDIEAVSQCMDMLDQRIKEDRLQKLFSSVDVHGNGLIDFDEFVRMMETHMRYQSENVELRALFAAFDKDKNGFIDASELKTTLADVGMEVTDGDVALMLKEAGVVVDGRIFYEDFVKMMSGQIGQEQRQCSLLAETGVDLSDSGEDENTELKMAFAMFDKNGDGVITSREVVEVMRSLGVNVDLKEVKQMVKRVDTDGNGAIDFEEFSTWMVKHKKLVGGLHPIKPHQANTDEMRQLFDVFDKDRDGKVNALEVEQTMQDLGMNLTAEDVASMMRQAGVGPEGNIYFQDFCRMMSDQLKSQPTHKFTGDQMKELKATFDMFDRDKDGEISIHEVVKVVKAIGEKPNSKTIEAMFKQVDLDGNGLINFDEFVLLVERQVHKRPDDIEMRAMFNALDKDNNGYIEPQELKATFRDLGVPLTDSDVREMLREAGVQGSLIYQQDFARLMNGQIGKAQKSASQRVSTIGVSMKPDLPTLTEADTPPRSPYNQQRTPKLDSKHTPIKAMSNGSTLHATPPPSPLHSAYSTASGTPAGTLEYGTKWSTLDSSVTSCSTCTRGTTGSLTNTGTLGSEVSTMCSHTGTMGSYTSSTETASIDSAGDGDTDTPHPIDPKLRDLRSAFSAQDKDCDGYINTEEFTRVLYNLGYKPGSQAIGRMGDIVEKEGRGRINFAQFSHLIRRKDSSWVKWRKHKTADARDMKEAFKTFDTEGAGYIKAEQLKSTLASLGLRLSDNVVCELVTEAQCEVPTRLYYQEFCKVLFGEIITPLPKVDNLTDEDLKKVRVTYHLYDSDNDGVITSQELRSIMRVLHIPDTHPIGRNLLHSCDYNGNGMLEFKEFLYIIAHRKHNKSDVLPHSKNKRNQEPEHWKAFKVFDRNRDGYITAKEIRITMRDLGIELTNKAVQKILAAADQNSDGKIDYREFSALLIESPDLMAEVCFQKERKEKTMYEHLYGKEFTESELHKAFNAFDHEGKGKISASDVALVMRSIGVTYDPNQLTKMISLASNGNGKVEFGEFLKMMSRSRTKHTSEESRKKSEEDEMRQAFKVFDIDGNGVIDAMELKMTMRNLGENLSDADVRAMIRTADKNGDGKIDYEEFIKMMYNK